MNTVFPKGLKGNQKSKMESVTLHGFGGGLNLVDDDQVMSPKFVKALKNFRRVPSGGQKLRWGQQFFNDVINPSHELREDGGFERREDGGFELREGIVLPPVGSDILDVTYFNNRLVAVSVNGWISSVNDLGQNEVIWAPTIAAALPGAPAFWSSGLTLITFVPFKNTLVIHNGVDKPLNIDNNFAVTYLQDLATGSNVNVPIGKYGCVASNYHCVAGFANAPTQIVISSQGTSGVFPLDPVPNDAITIDVGAYAPEGAASIRGIAGYRSFLIVMLQNINLQIKLGVYNTDTIPKHTPQFPDAFPTFGLIGSRCITKLDSDLAFAGIQGLTTAKRNQYIGSQIDNSLISSVIEPLYQKTFGVLTDTQKQLNTFAIFDQLNHDLMIFEPGGKAFCYSSNEKLSYKAWSVFEGMNWTSGCTSLLGRVFLTKGTKIFKSGNDTYGDKYYGDRLLDRDVTWTNSVAFTVGITAYDQDTNESYTCLVSHTSRGSGSFAIDRQANPSFWKLYTGIPIDFELEMPWFGGKDPMKVKKLRFISIGSKGTSEFTVEAYVDKLYKDFDGNTIYSPVVSMTFIGNDAPGFGVETGEGPFGTGRRSGDPRLYNYPVKFKSIKFRMYGSTIKPLEIANFSFLYARGSYFR